jgi:hypothetical protein
MDYTNDLDSLTSITTTWKPMTQQEIVEALLDTIRTYSKKKWYEKKKYYISQAVQLVKDFDDITNNINKGIRG